MEACAKQSQDGKVSSTIATQCNITGSVMNYIFLYFQVDISTLLNPTETSHYLQTAALLYGILNQVSFFSSFTVNNNSQGNMYMYDLKWNNCTHR